eukprot:12981451-Alexandrium_andersonii.AAC.1
MSAVLRVPSVGLVGANFDWPMSCFVFDGLEVEGDAGRGARPSAITTTPWQRAASRQRSSKMRWVGQARVRSFQKCERSQTSRGVKDLLRISS